MTVVGLAWPLLVTLTPAVGQALDLRDRRQQHLVADLRLQRHRPCRRPDGGPGGGAGGPGGGGGGGGFGGNLFGGSHRTVPAARDGSLGDQAGWLLGFAVVAGLALLRAHAPAPARSAHRLADRGRRRVPDHGGRRPDPSYVCKSADPYKAGYIASAAGFPEVTVPVSLISANMPVGLSFMGLPYQEAQLLGLAGALQRAEPRLPAPELR